MAGESSKTESCTMVAQSAVKNLSRFRFVDVPGEAILEGKGDLHETLKDYINDRRPVALMIFIDDGPLLAPTALTSLIGHTAARLGDIDKKYESAFAIYFVVNKVDRLLPAGAQGA